MKILDTLVIVRYIGGSVKRGVAPHRKGVQCIMHEEEQSIAAVAHACHCDMVTAGFWDEAEQATVPSDVTQLVVLADLTVAVAALAQRQRKGGVLDLVLIDRVADRLTTLRRVAETGAFTPYQRVAANGLVREEVAVTPTSGYAAHILRQLLHGTIEIGETLAQYHHDAYRITPTMLTEFADSGLVWFDLFGSFGPPAHAVFATKQRANRRRGRQYGRYQVRAQDGNGASSDGKNEESYPTRFRGPDHASHRLHTQSSEYGDSRVADND